MNQNVLNDFVKEIKTKYKNIVQDLKLEYIDEPGNVHIYLVLIKIKKSQRERGYGNSVLSDLIVLADNHHIKIRLWITNVYGSDLDRLAAFYMRHGFIHIPGFNDGEMMYFPKKKDKRKTEIS